MLERITGWSIRHPWLVLAGWVVLLAVVLGGLGSVRTVPTAQEDFRFGESGRMDALTARAGVVNRHQEMAHIGPAPGQAWDATEAGAAAEELSRAWRADPLVADVAPPATSQVDGSLLITATLRAPATDLDVDADSLASDLRQVAAEHPSVKLQQVGTISSEKAINDTVTRDLQQSERTSLPVTLVIMIAVFGSLIAAGLPVLVAGVSVATATGLAGVLSHVYPQDPSVMSMIVLFGMAVGVDYSLFYLKREREERARGHATPDAVRLAARTSGHAILTSGIAVAVALSGLLIMDFAAFDSLALGAFSVLVAAVLASLTLLPALLLRLGRWTDRLRIPGLGGRLAVVERARRRGVPVPPQPPSRLARLVAPVVRRPVAALLIGGAVVTALAAPALTLRTMSGSYDSMPADSPVVRAVRSLERSFPAQGTPAEVVTTYDRSSAEAKAAAGRELGRVAERAEAVGWQVAGEPRFTRGVAVLPLASTARSGSTRLATEVDELRDIAAAELSGPSSQHGITGYAANSLDMSRHLDARMPWAIAAVLALTAVMMSLTFSSVRIGLVTTVLNLASVGVALGVLAAVFQSDAGARLLHFTNTGAVRDWVPMFLFSVLVGLSMDYHVFVLSRIRENVRRGMPARAAIIDGVGRTGAVVTSAAVVMVGVFSIFATLTLSEMKQIGVGLAVAIALDATLIRLVLLPAMLALVGPGVWGRAGQEVAPMDPAEIRHAEPDLSDRPATPAVAG